MKGIIEYQLKNGLRVPLFPDASKPTVTVNITPDYAALYMANYILGDGFLNSRLTT